MSSLKRLIESKIQCLSREVKHLSRLTEPLENYIAIKEELEMLKEESLFQSEELSKY